jgi:hypothetical protein
MKVVQKNIKPGYQMQSESNNYRILCIDTTPRFVGFIGKDLVKDTMSMEAAVKWLYAEPGSEDTVCATCAKALCKVPVLIAAEGKMFCSAHCAKAWKRKIFEADIEQRLTQWLQDYGEEVSSESCGISNYYESEEEDESYE